MDSPRTPGRASTQLDEPGSSQLRVDGTQLLDDSPLYGSQLVYGDGDINESQLLGPQRVTGPLGDREAPPPRPPSWDTLEDEVK